jgi:hypothetical protein
LGSLVTNTYTVVTSHFGDTFWIRHSLTQLDRLSDDRVERVVVIDQSRRQREELAALPRVADVVTFDPDERQIHTLGHDHPASLNRALATVDFVTSHVLILDSDCFPMDPSWLDELGDATVAMDPAKWGLSHPCLMSFPSAIAKRLDFAEGLEEVGLDTGRLVGLQLRRLGVAVQFSQPEAAFRGHRGYFYLGRKAYHHGSGSFGHSTDARLLRQVDRRTEAFFQGKVARGETTLSVRERVRLAPKTISRILRSHI